MTIFYNYDFEYEDYVRQCVEEELERQLIEEDERAIQEEKEKGEEKC